MLLASMGLFSGEAPRAELNEEVDEADGEGLLRPPLLLPRRMFKIVSDMVCLAACLARSVETKLLTRSFRFPFTSGEANNSRGSTLEEEVAEGLFSVLAPLGSSLIAVEVAPILVGSVADLDGVVVYGGEEGEEGKEFALLLLLVVVFEE